VSEFEYIESASVSEHTAVVPSLGLLLRKAREARGLAVDDVVHALKFGARQIEAIEADRMDSLPGSVFVRGLIRSYARFLKLDPEPLLGLLDANTPIQAPDIRAPENMGNAGPRGGLLQIPPLVALSILLLLGAAAMIGWHFFGAGADNIRMSFENSRPVAKELKSDEPVKPEVVSRQANVEQPATAPLPEAPAVPVMPTDTRRLSFDFHGQSWIEVKDASGLVILTGIYTSGNQSVAGRPPFEIVIGNAAVVTMVDEGHPVDLKAYTRAEVARLTLE
jgi:cytoskeleton protein RodZ